LPSQWNTDRDGDGINDCKISSNVPLNINTIAIKNNLNKVYNQIGIKIDLIDKGYDTLNYNATDIVRNAIDETEYIHISYFGSDENNLVQADTATIFMLDEMDVGEKFKRTGRSGGRGLINASGIGIKSCFINTTAWLGPKSRDRTIPHEVGHGVYSIFHPNTKYGKTYDKLLNYVKSDIYNYMNSGGIYKCCTVKNIDEYRVRKYQWKYIRDGK